MQYLAQYVVRVEGARTVADHPLKKPLIQAERSAESSEAPTMERDCQPGKTGPFSTLMELKHLSVRFVSDRARVPYNTTSQILIGRMINPEALAKIEGAIERAPMPARESLQQVLREMEMEAAA